MLLALDDLTEKHNETLYYEIRSLDKDKESFNKLPDYIRAARTIYLNKAGFIKGKNYFKEMESRFKCHIWK